MDIIKELESLRRSHYHCEDGWYNYPAHPDGSLNPEEDTECNCGADEYNAKLDEIIAEVHKLVK